MSHLGSLLLRFSLTVAAIVMSHSVLLAHDLWIEPTTFSPALGERVGVRLRVGEDLRGDPLPRNSSRINQFFVEDAAGRTPVIGRHGANPAGSLRVTTPGMLVIGYSSHPSTVELTADKFNQYLKEEGLDAVVALRAQRNETDAKTRELFSRCGKSLLLSGSPTATQGDRPLGLTLELVAERNPYALGPDEELPVRLTYKNQPLTNALVIAMNQRNPSDKQKARTDNTGRVRFRLPSDGLWLIKAVHTIPAPADANAEWESFWASLTFALPTTNTHGKEETKSSVHNQPSAFSTHEQPRTRSLFRLPISPLRIVPAPLGWSRPECAHPPCAVDRPPPGRLPRTPGHARV